MVEVNESLIDKYEQIYDEEHNYDDEYNRKWIIIHII